MKLHSQGVIRFVCEMSHIKPRERRPWVYTRKIATCWSDSPPRFLLAETGQDTGKLISLGIHPPLITWVTKTFGTTFRRTSIFATASFACGAGRVTTPT